MHKKTSCLVLYCLQVFFRYMFSLPECFSCFFISFLNSRMVFILVFFKKFVFSYDTVYCAKAHPYRLFHPSRTVRFFNRYVFVFQLQKYVFKFIPAYIHVTQGWGPRAVLELEDPKSWPWPWPLSGLALALASIHRSPVTGL